MPEQNLPGPVDGIAKKQLHFIWIADCSGSMKDNGKIQALNQAIREVLPHMANEAQSHPEVEVLVRAVKFSNGAQWHVAQPTSPGNFQWQDLSADGVTDMGKALELIANEMKSPNWPKKGVPPVLVLITDGQPTDDFEKGRRELMNTQWGKKAVRVAIAIGEDADLEPLNKFMDTKGGELKPLQANNPEQLIKMMKWASTLVKSVVKPEIEAGKPAGVAVPIPAPPAELSKSKSADVW